MKNIRAFLGVLAACFLLALPGCRSPLEHLDMEDNDSRAGTLLLSINRQDMGRTIIPATTLDDFVEFRLVFIATCDTGNSNYNVSWIRGEVTHDSDTVASTVELDPGIWDLHITAYLADGDEFREAARGSLKGIDVPSGVTVSGNVTLYPISLGEGMFSWDIGFPANVASVEIVFTDVSGADIPDVDAITFYVPDGETEWSDYAWLPAGRYRIIFTLTNNYGERAVASRILHVYKNMESNFNMIFEDGHFLVSLLHIILGAWDGSQWDFEYAEIKAGYFDLLYVKGVYANNLPDIAHWFNELSTPATIPVDLDGLKTLVDAALIGIGSTEADFLAGTFGNRTEAQNAIAEFVRNSSSTGFAWADYHTVTVGIGAFGVEIVFINAVYPGFLVPGISFANQLAWLRAYAQNGNRYLVEISEDETVADPGGTGFLPAFRDNIAIVVSGMGEMRNVVFSAVGMLWVPSGVTLVLDKNVTLQGIEQNSNPLVGVGGTLIMNTGSRIVGNRNTTNAGSSGGGGVRVDSGGVFVLDGGEISGNSTTATTVDVWGGHAGHGGGVRVRSGGRFDMLSGTISDNAGQNGGGVHIEDDARFNMLSGTISSNTARGSGGGVNIANGGGFDMLNGTISGNAAGWGGGGVHVNSGSSFRMSSGVLYGDETTVGESFRNTTGGNGASLSATSYTTAQRGTFANGVFNSLGSLPTANITLHMENGILQMVDGSLSVSFTWLQLFAQSGGEYIVKISEDETVAPSDTFITGSLTLPTGRDNLTIILRGIGEMRTVNLSANGSHFWVPSGVALVLDENVTLQGRTGNSNHLVRVNDGGTLIMNEGSRVVGNQNNTGVDANGGGGVRVNSGGVFILDGGEISGNSTTSTGTLAGAPGHGGGVRVESDGRFDMHSGTISGNIGQNGGGVFVRSGGTFRMSSGVIYGNEVAEADLRNTARSFGASLYNIGISEYGTFANGVFNSLGSLPSINITLHMENGILQMVDGSLSVQFTWLRLFAQSGGEYIVKISEDETVAPSDTFITGSLTLPTGKDNLTIILRGIGEMRTVNLSANGSHFWVPSGVTLVLDENVTLQGRTGNSNHLVRVNDGGTLIMNEGSRVVGNQNNATGPFVNGGGGVSVNSGGVFTLDGGEISGNSTTNTSTAFGIVPGGGGVRVEYGGRFDMLSGIISGNTGQYGGGVLVGSGGIFRMGSGVIYGNEVAEADLRNTARSNGASLNNAGLSEFGTFNGVGVFTSSGDLPTTNNTIRVVNGVLQ